MKIKLLFILLSIYFNSYSQNNNTKYGNNFSFNDGIYINFDDFKTNQSIAFSQIITNKIPENIESINALLKNKKIKYFDKNGVENEIKSKSIWGYSFNNKVYINLNGEFNIIPIIGNISHFIANKQVYNNSYIDPFDDGFSSIDRPTTEPQEYILDFNTGAIYEFTIKNFQLLISVDSTLYTEFAKLKKREKREMIYIFLRRFNKSHPIYFYEK